MELNVETDPQTRTITVTAAFDHPRDKVWQLLADPRKLERWWGPPTYPAKVTRHELAPAGVVLYTMTGPEGDEHHGRWDVESVDEPDGFVVVDLFADAEGNPVPDMPVTRMDYRFTDTPTGTRMVSTAVYPTLEQLEQVVAMGMEEGLRAAMGQIEPILAEG